MVHLEPCLFRRIESRERVHFLRWVFKMILSFDWLFISFSLIGWKLNPNFILKTLCEEKARNREDREQGRKKNDSAIKIQKQVRGFICRRRLEKARLADAKAFMEQNPDWSNLQNKSIFIALRGLLFKYDKPGFRTLFSTRLIGRGDPGSLIGWGKPGEGCRRSVGKCLPRTYRESSQWKRVCLYLVLCFTLLERFCNFMRATDSKTHCCY